MVLPQRLKLPLCEHHLSRRLLFGISSAILMLQSLFVHLWGPQALRFQLTIPTVVHVPTYSQSMLCCGRIFRWRNFEAVSDKEQLTKACVQSYGSACIGFVQRILRTSAKITVMHYLSPNPLFCMTKFSSTLQHAAIKPLLF